MTDRVGQQLGNYRLTRLLGHGGFADVYLGEHVFLKTQAAIKVLHTQLTPDTRGNFLTEAQTIARLVHSHIVRVLDFGVENSIPFLVMEYAPNGTLRQRHPRGSILPLPLIVSYVMQIAGGLQHAHDQRLVHRDVKPENMLLGHNHEILLSDFGIATIAHTSRSLSTVDISGTIAYMAPEQVQGKSRPASDQYSLGIITYEWLTGRCPFQGSFAEIASQHMFTAPPSIRISSTAIPADVEEVLMMALAKNPDARFARVEAFANALKQAGESTQFPQPDATPTFISPSSTAPTLLAPPPTQLPASVAPLNTDPTSMPAPAAYRPSPGMPPSSPSLTPPASLPDTVNVSPMVDRSRRGISRRTVIGGVFGFAVVAAGGAAWYLISHPQSPSHSITTPTVVPNPTSQPTSMPSPQHTTPVTNSPLIYRGPYQEFTVAWSPDSTKIASAGNGSIIQVWNPTTGSPIFSMNSGSGSVFSVAWSPDGTKIASGQLDGTVKIWDAVNGSLIFSLPGHTNQVNSVAWSPDSTKVVSGAGDKTARVWEASTGNYLFSYTGHVHYVNAVAWSPDGTRIVSGSGNHIDNHNAQVWDAGNGNPIYTFNGHSDEILALAWSRDSTRIASASDDNTVKIWDATNGTVYVNYTRHTNYVVAMRWSPDGTRIASGGVDTMVQVWDAFSGNLLYTYPGHSAEVEGVAWAPDSRHVASASRDMTVQVWQAP